MTKVNLAKVDLHLHSYASNVTDYYAANAFSIPESYSDPVKLYSLLKARGMALVTLTDHNSIDGVRELLDAGYPDVFISAEMTATFPEDGCNIHVTVANVTERQFGEIHRLRGNIYDMIGYVDAQIADEARDAGANRIAYFMTHPLMSTQNRPYGREGALGVHHIEKALLLCNCLEVRNGGRTKALNELTLRLLRSLTRDTIERLADRHGIAPKGKTPWVKSVVGGSDDHSGINPGLTWTEFDSGTEHPTPNALVDAIRNGRTQPAGIHGGPITVAHSILKLLYEGSSRKGHAAGAKSVKISGATHSLLRLVFDDRSGPLWDRLGLTRRIWARRLLGNALPAWGSGAAFEDILESEACALLADTNFKSQLGATGCADDRIFLVVKTLVHRIFARYLDRVRSAAGSNFVGTIKEIVALCSSNLFVSLPYVATFVQQSADGLISRDVRKAFGLSEAPKLVLVTDTFFEVNGVAATIKRMIREATRRGLSLTVVTCLAAEEIAVRMRDPQIADWVESGRLRLFSSIASVDFPEYDGLRVHFPPLLDMLRYLQESGFTKMQISTPGAIGITGLFAAKLLQIETAATYHTCLPEYVENYTRDVSLEALAWRYVILFYHAVDEVLVPSRFVARLLHKRGLRNRKLLILDRWVDVERFHPSRRVPGFWERAGIADAAARTKFVYVGRVAVEKNLQLVAGAYRMLCEARRDAHLIIIGDGPYRKDLEQQVRGLPVTFTGFMEGEELVRALASADVKLFPSTTDTWGNAPLEAQACGLPVIVSETGGPVELMRDGETGIVVSGRDARELRNAMEKLMDPALRADMGRRARDFVEENRVDEPFTAVLDAEAYRRRLQAAKQADSRASSPLTTQILDLLQFDSHDGELPRREVA
ncbi:MAG TPA: glycosyltransferase [Burkholderiales bacterium]|nr:glycosyltransferase [Burkholderiales bacterium]